MHKVGGMIALQDDEGHVYMGLVTSVEKHGGSTDYAVDVIADGVYRYAYQREHSES